MDLDLHPDFQDLLHSFVEANVEFVVVGGFAVEPSSTSQASPSDSSFIGRNELVANKRASGRSKDLADLEALGVVPAK